jgi:hypothetical protein
MKCCLTDLDKGMSATVAQWKARLPPTFGVTALNAQMPRRGP